MRYMMLIHHDEPALAAADQKQLWQDYAAFNEALDDIPQFANITRPIIFIQNT